MHSKFLHLVLTSCFLYPGRFCRLLFSVSEWGHVWGFNTNVFCNFTLRCLIKHKTKSKNRWRDWSVRWSWLFSVIVLSACFHTWLVEFDCAFVSPDNRSIQSRSFHTEFSPWIFSNRPAFMIWFASASIGLLVLPWNHYLHKTFFKFNCCLESPLFLEMRWFRQLSASDSYRKRVRGSRTQSLSQYSRWYLVQNKAVVGR